MSPAMRLVPLLVGGAMVTALLVAPAPSAAAATSRECGTGTLCVTAGGDGISATGSRVTGGSPGGEGATGPSGGRAPGGSGPATTVVTERRIAPACSGNSPEQDGSVCTGAVSICRTPGDVAYWVWTRQVDLGAVDAPPGPWRRATVPPYVCYAPDAPGLPPTASVAGTLQRDFAHYPLARAVTRTEPAGATLVNLATNLYTDTPVEQTFTVTVLGVPVVVTAHARRWTWHFGDGHTLGTDGPGRAGTLDVSHTYGATGGVAPYVVVEWTGTYRMPGAAEPLPVRGTATTVGPPQPLEVRQARSQYEAGGPG